MPGARRPRRASPAAVDGSDESSLPEQNKEALLDTLPLGDHQMVNDAIAQFGLEAVGDEATHAE